MQQAGNSTGLRRHARVHARLRVRYGIEGLEREDFAESISVGGLYVRTNDIYKVGTRVKVEITFPEAVMRRRGEVVWAIQAPAHLKDRMVVGMGISFLDQDPPWVEFFRRFSENCVFA